MRMGSAMLCSLLLRVRMRLDYKPIAPACPKGRVGDSALRFDAEVGFQVGQANSSQHERDAGVKLHILRDQQLDFEG